MWIFYLALATAEIESDIVSNLNKEFEIVSGESEELYSYFKPTYSLDLDSSSKISVILLNSTQTLKMELHFFVINSTSETLIIFNHTSPNFEQLSLTVQKLKENFNIDLSEDFSNVTIIEANKQTLGVQKSEFNLIEILFKGDEKLYKKYSLTEKGEIISEFQWLLSSNRVKFETVSDFYVIPLSLVLSSAATIIIVYAIFKYNK